MTASNSDTTTQSRSKLWWLPYVLFAAATLIFFRTQIFGTDFFWDDFAEYVYPVRAFAAKHMSAGEIPFWNPYSFCGMPFMADVQTALFYPPNLLLDMVSGGSPYPIKNLQLLIILHYFIAQCSMYVLGRKLNISLGGSTIAALSYGFSAPLVLHAFHPMQVEHLAWFPLIIACVYSALSMRSVLYAVIGGLLLGMTMLSGSPQMTLYIGFFIGLMTLWFSLSGILSKTSNILQASATAGLGGAVLAIGFGVFCVQYLPVREIASLSERAEISYEKASVGSLEYKQLINTTVPKAFGSMSPDQRNKAPFFLHERDYYLYWDTAFYFGVCAFILGLIAIQRYWRDKLWMFFIGSALFAFLFAVGSNGFVFPVFFQLPFFNALRIPARMMFLFSFCFCLLAAKGWDALTENSKNSSSLRPLIIAAAIPLFFAFGAASGFMIDIPSEKMESTIHGYGLVGILFVLAATALFFLVQRKVIKSEMGAWIVVLLVFIDLNLALGDFNQSKRNPVKEGQEMFSDALRSQLLPAPPDSLFRVSMRAPGVIALKRNQGMTDGVMLYEGYNQLLLARRHPEVGNIKRMLDLLNVKYEIAVDSLRGTAGFVRRPEYFPEAWMVYQTKVADEQSIQKVLADSNDYHSLAVIETPLTSPLSSKKASEVNHAVRCTEYHDNHASYEVRTDESGLCCFSEIWYPAWRAYVDGRPADVYRVNYCLRGVVVPPGTHTVEWRFESETFRSGMNISLATLVLSVATLVIAQIRSMRKNSSI